MRKENIALLKKFLIGRGIETIFVGLYKSDLKNELSMDEYLERADESEVLSKAFFIDYEREDEKSPFRKREYWREQQRLFNREIENAEAEGWYLPTNVHNVTKWYNEEIEVIKRGIKSKKKQQENNTKDLMGMKGLSQFKFFDLNNNLQRRNTISDDEIAVSTRKGSHKLSFSVAHSREILSSGLRYMAIGQDEFTGQVRLIFNNDGNGLQYPPSCVKDKKVVVNSKALTDLLSELFNESGDYYTLRISNNIAHSAKYLTYNIDKK